MDSILLHVCCGPCSTVPIKLLIEEGADLACLFFNPNISSQEEYDIRWETFRCFAADSNVKVIAPFYDTRIWEDALRSLAGVFPLIKTDPDFEENFKKRKARCSACYAFRFEELAKQAKQEGYQRISTTLSISPYQFIDTMAQTLAQVAEKYGLQEAFFDYRPFYQESVRRSKELGMYRQSYCGCSYSREEAELERKAKRVTFAAREDNSEESAHG